MTYKEFIQYIEDTENSDENLPKLKALAEYYCATYDLCEGYKHALIDCLEDQYKNHPEDQEEGDIEKLKAMLDESDNCA